MVSETNKNKKMRFFKLLNREYTSDEFKLAVYLTLFFCILAFSSVGQSILIGFTKIVAILSGFAAVGIGSLRRLHKEREEEDVFEVESITNAEEDEVLIFGLDEELVEQEATVEETKIDLVKEQDNEREKIVSEIEAEPIYLFDKSGLKDLARYFKDTGIKYWEVTKSYCIIRMPPNMASVASAMKKKMCYVPSSVVEELIETTDERFEIQPNDTENGIKKASQKILPDEYKFIINHFVMIDDLNLLASEQKNKCREKKVRKKQVPELIQYATFLTETEQRRIRLITQNAELKDFEDDKISILALSEVA